MALRLRVPGWLPLAGAGPTPQQLAAEATIAFTADGALTVRRRLAAEASIGVTADGALTVPRRLAAEAVIVVVADASLTGGSEPGAAGEIITTRRRRR